MIRLARPRLGPAELSGVRKVLTSGMLVQGGEVQRFEEEVAAYVGTRHAVAVSSGTAALHLALLALGVGPGDEVIAPAFTFPATTNVIEHVGAATTLADIDLRSFCLDSARMAEALSERTRAVVVVHEFGQSADLDRILDCARSRGLFVIEDAACALGTEHRGQRVGGIGEVGCFSFHPRKAITTGEGGVLVTNSNDLARRVRRLRNHGQEAGADGAISFVEAGFNYRLTNFQGAMGRAQMKRLPGQIQRRRELAARYDPYFASSGLIQAPARMEYGLHVFQTYHVLLPQGCDRTVVIELLKTRGIETNRGAYAIHEQPYYQRRYGYRDSQFENASMAAQRGLALPLHDGLSRRDIRRVAEALISCVEALQK